MKRIFAALLALLLAAVPAQAQTATPTTSPFVHTQGEYLFISDPNITYSGVWTNQVNGFLTYKQTTSTAAYAAFTVSDDICTVSLGLQGNSGSPTNIQINAGTPTVYTGITPAIGFPMIVDTSGVSGDFTVKLFISAGGNLLQLFRFQLLECPDNTPVPTATILPSSTPFSPVPTATILPSSTPFIPEPTATILPSSTPANTPVDTPTPANTPVDTPTPLDIDATINALETLIASGGGCGCGPTDTPTITNTPTDTVTPSPEPWSWVTVTSGQLTRIDFTVNAGEAHNANIITLILFSLWAMFFFAVFMYWRKR